jgi:20S proteasome alpha/beta subunit
MTICLAALCNEEDEPRAVVVADRMVTLGGFIEFEHAMPKMAAASPSAIVMVAGDSLVGTRIAQDVADAVADAGPQLADLARELARAYDRARQVRMEEEHLLPRGLTMQSFYGAHQTLSPQITMMIDSALAGFNLGVELLLAGVDTSGAHIHTIYNPGGTERLHDTIGYAAVGSGTIHALQSMIGFCHQPTAEFHETVFRVYASKRRAEVAPGVGSDTDMAVISAAGLHWLTDDELGQLAQMYDDHERSTGDALADQLKDFSLGQEVPSGS